MGFNHQGPRYFEKNSILPFCYAILLWGIWARGLLHDTMLVTERLESTIEILPSIIRPKDLNFFIELGMHHFIEHNKLIRDLRLVLQ